MKASRHRTPPGQWSRRTCRPRSGPGAAAEILTDPFGELRRVDASEVPDLLTRTFGDPGRRSTLRLFAETVDGDVRGQVWVSERSAFVAIECEATPWHEEATIERPGLRGRVCIAYAALADLPQLWLRWAGSLEMGAGPSAMVADVTAIDRRIRCVQEPVPEGAEALTPMWSGEWRRWGICDEASGRRLQYVAVPDHGVYVERPLLGGVEFALRPSSLVWGDLVALYCALQPVRQEAGNTAHW